MAKNARSKDFTTVEGRGSFVHLFEKEKKQDGSEGNNYSMTLLFPKKSDNWRGDLPELWDACKEVITAQFPDANTRPPVWSANGVGKPWPVKDGDVGNTQGVVREEQKGMWCVRLISSRFDSSVNLLNGIDKTLGTLTEQTCFSGCYFKAKANAFFYTVEGSAGISIGLNNLMMTKVGERFGDGGPTVNAADDFGIEVSEQTAKTDFDDAFAI